MPGCAKRRAAKLPGVSPRNEDARRNRRSAAN